MNYGLKQLALYVRDLLAYDEQLIRIGRESFVMEDFDTNYIVVDSIGPDNRISRGNSYDGELEVQTLTARLEAPCTINFYGNDAYTNATKFIVMMGSQLSQDLQDSLGVTVFTVSSLTNIKALNGQQYGNNIELQLNMQYNQTIELDVLRIDTEQFEITQQ